VIVLLELRGILFLGVAIRNGGVFRADSGAAPGGPGGRGLELVVVWHNIFMDSMEREWMQIGVV
jgi:hypothetical protein